MKSKVKLSSCIRYCEEKNFFGDILSDVLSCNVAVVVTVKQSTGRQWQQAIFASGTSYAAAAAAGTDASLQGKHPIALFCSPRCRNSASVLPLHGTDWLRDDADTRGGFVVIGAVRPIPYIQANLQFRRNNSSYSRAKHLACFWQFQPA